MTDTAQTTICPRCGGRGDLPVAEPECNGGRTTEPCDRCGGTGRQAAQATTALVDRLRLWPAAPEGDALSVSFVSALMGEAAIEIERLRAMARSAAADARVAGDATRHWEEAAKRLANEISRLRAALARHERNKQDAKMMPDSIIEVGL